MTTDGAAILLVTTAVDAASDAVAAALTAAGAKFVRLNTEDLPLRALSSIHIETSGTIARWQVDNSSALLNRVRRVWFRRHRLPAFPPDAEPAHVEYCLRESQWFLRGLMFELAETVPESEWMSHPLSVERAESKPLQLRVAHSVGLECPPTLVSNDPAEIRAFFDRHDGKVVAKAVRSGYFDYGSIQRATFTTTLRVQDLDDDEALSAAPVIYQPHLEKQYDIRVTIVGNALYAAAIHSQDEPSARVDWRQTNTDLIHTALTLPSELADACHALMRRLNLRFGALDFVLSPGGQYSFLEVNPSGQWLWIEDKLGFPISRAIADWLMR